MINPNRGEGTGVIAGGGRTLYLCPQKSNLCNTRGWSCFPIVANYSLTTGAWKKIIMKFSLHLESYSQGLWLHARSKRCGVKHVLFFSSVTWQLKASKDTFISEGLRSTKPLLCQGLHSYKHTICGVKETQTADGEPFYQRTWLSPLCTYSDYVEDSMFGTLQGAAEQKLHVFI